MHRITLIGNPISSQTIYRFHSRGGYMTTKGKDLKKSYQWQAKSQYRGEPLATPLKLTIQLFFGDRRSRDWDNFHKLSMDALNGIVWVDDSLIEEVTVTKSYDKKNPRIDLIIEPLLH